MWLLLFVENLEALELLALQKFERGASAGGNMTYPIFQAKILDSRGTVAGYRTSAGGKGVAVRGEEGWDDAIDAFTIAIGKHQLQLDGSEWPREFVEESISRLVKKNRLTRCEDGWIFHG